MNFTNIAKGITMHMYIYLDNKNLKKISKFVLPLLGIVKRNGFFFQFFGLLTIHELYKRTMQYNLRKNEYDFVTKENSSKIVKFS